MEPFNLPSNLLILLLIRVVKSFTRRFIALTAHGSEASLVQICKLAAMSDAVAWEF